MVMNGTRLEEVIERFAPALQRLARSYEHDPSLQQDLVQDILIALARALPSFEARSSLATFVFRVAHNVGISHSLRARRRATSRWLSLEDLASDPVSDTTAPDQLLDQPEKIARLHALVAKLKPLDRQLVLLVLEGLSPGEIAEVTGLSLTNITTKVSRVRSTLRKNLGGAS